MKLPFLPYWAAQRFARETAVISRRQTLTFAELARYADELARVINETDPTDERLLFEAVPSIQTIALFCAAIGLRRVAVPLNYRLPDAALNDQLNFLKARAFFGTKERILPQWRPVPDLSPTVPEKSMKFMPDFIDDQQAVNLIFTSGSTGQPRAVVHAYGNHYFSAKGSAQNIPVHRGDRWLLSLPMYHVSGIAILFRTMMAGAAVILPDDSMTLAQNIVRFKPTHLSLVATQLHDLLQEKNQRVDAILRDARAILTGGSAIPQNLLRQAYERHWPLVLSYGSSEMSSQITATAPNADFDEWLTSGRILPHREVRITADGEIQVRGKTLFLGYWQGNKLTRPLTDDGWFATGDVGHWDAKERLVVLGRKDRMFISGGENIFPEEIERALERMPQVIKATVVPVPDARFGQRPLAFVQVTSWQVKMERQFKDELRKFLPGYKIPVRILPWPSDAPQGIKVPLVWLKEKALELMKGED